MDGRVCLPRGLARRREMTGFRCRGRGVYVVLTHIHAYADIRTLFYLSIWTLEEQ
jgi:hypothetical protein